MKGLLKNIIFLFLSLLVFDVCASELFFNQLRVKDGLSDDKATAIVRDTEGFVWIATQDGLNRFDGKSIVTYFFDKNDSTSLPSNVISALCLDNDGDLWVGTRDGGLSFFNRETNDFTNYDIDNSTIISNSINAIELDNEGNLWIATVLGISVFDKGKHTFSPATYKSLTGAVDTITDNIISLDISFNNTVWMGGEDAVFKYSPQEKVYDTVIAAPKKFSKPFGISVVQDRNTLWVGTRNGLIEYKTQLDEYTVHTFVDKGFVSNKINDIVVTAPGQIWFSLDFSGIVEYNDFTEEYKFHRDNKFDSNSLGGKRVRQIYFDNKGVLWLAKNRRGVSYSIITESAKLIRFFGKDYQKFYDAFSAINFMNDSIVAVGIDGFGMKLCKISLEEGRLDVLKEFLPKSSVMTICFSPSKDTIWAGTYKDGLAMITLRDDKTRYFKHHPDDSTSLMNNDIRSIIYTKDNKKLLISNHGSGVAYFDIASFTAENIKAKRRGKDMIANIWVYEALEGQDESLWVATAFGLFERPIGSDIFIKREPTTFQPHLVPQQHFTDIHETKNGEIWLATENGLSHYNREEDSFYVYIPSAIERRNFVVQSLQESKDGKLWISSNSGLLEFDRETKQFNRVLQSDVLETLSFFRRSSATNSSGLIAYGCTKGIFIFEADRVFDDVNLFAPSPILYEFRLYNDEITSKTDKDLLPQNINYVTELRFDHDQNFISIYYSAIDVFAPHLRKYRYKLKGIDADWNYVGNHNRAVYTDLAPGKYEFELSVSRDGEKWHDRDSALKIIISKPWWQTYWFRTIVVLATILLIFFLYRLRMQRIKKNEKKLAALVRVRTSELEDALAVLEDKNEEINTINERLNIQTLKINSQKERLGEKNIKLEELNDTKDKFMSIIAHDLKNPLHSILGFSELMVTRAGKVDIKRQVKYSKQINSSANHLLNILDNLLYWARSQTDHIQLKPKRLHSDLVIFKTIELLQQSADHKEVALSNNSSYSYEFKADENMIDTILRNLISNAIKFSYRNSAVSVTAVEQNDGVCFSIKDNGVGMTAEQADSVFLIGEKMSTVGTEEEKGTGLGLIICKEFVEKHKGRIWVESEEEQGSEFFFWLPSNK